MAVLFPGYDHKDRQLHVNEAEASRSGISSISISIEIRVRSYDYPRPTDIGAQRLRAMGGVEAALYFQRNLYHLLSNPVYIGKTDMEGNSTKAAQSNHRPETRDQTAELLAANREAANVPECGLWANPVGTIVR
jgi:hypothetical protein